MPSKNSEPEYSKIRKNNAIVLNHSPSNEITDAAHNLRYLALLEKNSMYPFVKAHSSSINSCPGSKRLQIIHLDVGVLDLSAVELRGTSTLASGK